MFRTAEVVEAMNLSLQMSGALLINGGMSINPYFVQFLANVTQREIKPAMFPELTGLGTAQLASNGLGE